MAGPNPKVSQARKFWLFVTGQRREASKPAMPPVVVHDPAAKRAHDLDDPFFDAKVQKRMADVIAGASHKK